MSTRSLIGRVLDDSGKCKVVYCHSDGYIEEPGVGDTLLKYYKTSEQINKLLDLGNLSFLGKIPESFPEQWKDANYEYCRSYKDRGDTGEEAKVFESPAHALENWGQEYNYFFIDKNWYCYHNGKIIDLETKETLKREGD